MNLENDNFTVEETETRIRIKEIRNKLGLKQAEFAEKFGIPKRTIESWEGNAKISRREAPGYVINMIEKIIMLEERNAYLECRNHLLEKEIASIMPDR